jgi:hypothetical protein
MKVLSRDDIELGSVKEVTGECFKIDAPMALDYWLAGSTVTRMDDGIVHLGVSKLDVDDFKQDKPETAHSGIHRHT